MEIVKSLPALEIHLLDLEGTEDRYQNSLRVL